MSDPAKPLSAAVCECGPVCAACGRPRQSAPVIEDALRVAAIEYLDHISGGHAEPRCDQRQAHEDALRVAAFAPATGAACWFCKRVVSVDALIAGYDTFGEQRLACLACNERMSGNWRASR